MATNITKIFLVLNSGSSSEKFSLYEGQDEVCSLYFEGVEIDGKKKFICTVSKADGSEEKVNKTWDSLDIAFKEAKAIFEKEGFINESHPLDGILVRTPAAGTYFSKHHILTLPPLRGPPSLSGRIIFASPERGGVSRRLTEGFAFHYIPFSLNCKPSYFNNLKIK